jgi:hypothetical protein
MGAITPEERAVVRARSTLGGKYDLLVNRESAYEILTRRTLEKAEVAEAEKAAVKDAPSEGSGGMISDFLWGTKRRQGMVETMAKQAARTVGSQLGRKIIRGILGGILGGSGRR